MLRIGGLAGAAGDGITLGVALLRGAVVVLCAGIGPGTAST